VYQPLAMQFASPTLTSNLIENNILWSQVGYDINVDPTSQVGFSSDYNDLYTTLQEGRFLGGQFMRRAQIGS